MDNKIIQSISTDKLYLIDGMIYNNLNDIDENNLALNMNILIGGKNGGLFNVTNTPPTIIDYVVGNFTLKRIIDDNIINVEAFGAKGDGVTDDTKALQNAINYSSSNNINIKLTGDYVITKPLILKETCCLYGGIYNNEYNKRSSIISNVSNTFELSERVVGVVLDGILFNGKNMCFNSLNENGVLAWGVIKNCGFINFTSVFNLFILGTKIHDVFINYVQSSGILIGSDNFISNCFINNNNNTNTGTLLTLKNFNLSRLTNIYFTGKDKTLTGTPNLLNIQGTCSNLEINGCFFDLSNGYAVNINGAVYDFPKSGCTNITFINCLFRGNCQDIDSTIASNVINVSNARNISFITNAFKDVGSLGSSMNPNSKIFNFINTVQGILLESNYYEIPYSANNDENISMLETFPYKANNWGIQSTTVNKINLQHATVTTDGTYGSAIVGFNKYYSETPIVFCKVKSTTIIALVNSTTSKRVELVFRKIIDGQPVTSTTLEIDLFMVENV